MKGRPIDHMSIIEAQEEEIAHCKWLLEQAKATIRKQCENYEELLSDLVAFKDDNAKAWAENNELWREVRELTFANDRMDSRIELLESRLPAERAARIRRSEQREEAIAEIRRDEYPEEEYYNGLEER